MATRTDRLAAFLKRNAKYINSIRLNWIGIDEEVHYFSTIPKDQIAEAPNAAADMILTECQDNVDGAGSSVRYRIDIINSDDELVKTHVVKLLPSEGAIDPLDLQSVEGVGASNQLVRISEGLLRVLVQSMAVVQKGYEKLLQDQRIEIRELRARECQMQDTAHKLLISQASEELATDRNDQAIDKLAAIAEKFISGHGMPVDDV